MIPPRQEPLANPELALESAGQLGYLLAELDSLQAAVESVPLWTPGGPLCRQIDWVRQELLHIEANWSRKLLVVIAGPSGAGKSTLLNALAGDDLSPTGLDRPTTREIVVYCQSQADLGHLLDDWPADHLSVHTDPLAGGLDHLILVDTPDTNTVPENQAVLALALEAADVILAVLNAANPKLQDNAAFLAPFIRRIGVEAVVPVLNAVDRVAPTPLRQDILPDTSRYLESAWGMAQPRIYAIVARAHAPGTAVTPDETPLHTIDEFAALQQWLHEQLNSAQQVVDRRLARGEHLMRQLRLAIRNALSERAATLTEARAALDALQSELARSALEQVRADRTSLTQARRLVMVQLAADWWGPVGWLVALWSALLRLTRPQARRGEIDGLSSEGWLARLARLYAQLWPPVADKLIAAGIAPEVRQASYWRLEGERQAKALERAQAQAWGNAVSRLAHGLSLWPLQLVLNAAPIGFLGWIGYASVRAFVTRTVLPEGYYQNGGVATLAVWLTSLILLQVLIALTCSWSLPRRVARTLRKDVGELPLGALQEQLRALEHLARQIDEVAHDV